MQTLSSLPAEKKAHIKERENLYRFETWCILRGIKPTNEMRAKVNIACLDWYANNPTKTDVPSAVLIACAGEEKAPVLA